MFAEMEEKVRAMIDILEADADSFAKKAEMYYQRRPELIKLVDETYKIYKALSDRCDRISGELHKANHTVASAFPDQLQFAVQDDEEDGSPKAFTDIDTSKFRKPQINIRNKNQDALAALKKHHKKVISHITKENVQSEIDRLQKEILVLQTEKEFVKSSHESSLAKFWEIENRITDLQDEVCTLQDEYSVSSIIEDNEARALMAATAIKTCEESLVGLQQQEKKSGEEAEVEYKRIREVNNRLKVLKGEKCSAEIEEIFDREISNEEEEGSHLKNEGLDLYSVCAKMKQHFQMGSDSLVVDHADKIDELVEKVISLEVLVESQTAHIHTLRSETNMLQNQLQCLEEDKANMIIDSNSLNVRLRQAEDELHGIQDLEKIIHHEKGIFQTQFLEACNGLNDISEKLQSPCSNVKDGDSAYSKFENLMKNEEVKEGVRDESVVAAAEEFEPNAVDTKAQSLSNKASTELVNDLAMVKREQLNAMVSSLLKDLEPDDGDDSPDWQKVLNNGPEGRRKLLLYGYSSILQNYKDTKKRLAEIDKKNQEYHFEMMDQIQELKSVNAVKDQEIRDLRMKLFYQSSSKGATSSQKETRMQNKEDGSPIHALKINTDCPIESVDVEEEIKLCHLDQQLSTSPIEEKFRAELNALLDENLNFWLRFSTSYHQIQKFDVSFKELEAGVDKMKDPKEGGSAPASPKPSMKQNSPPLDKKLRELHTKLQVWLEQNELLKEELQCRFTSLCNIQEEISKASRDAEGKHSKFTPYQAAKFQGELLNLQQENNKVAMELQTGLDHAKALQSRVTLALSKLKESFDRSVSNGYQQYQNFRHCSTRSKIPLRTFLFGEKRKKASIFSCMSSALYRHNSQVKSGSP